MESQNPSMTTLTFIKLFPKVTIIPSTALARVQHKAFWSCLSFTKMERQLPFSEVAYSDCTQLCFDKLLFLFSLIDVCNSSSPFHNLNKSVHKSRQLARSGSTTCFCRCQLSSSFHWLHDLVSC